MRKAAIISSLLMIMAPALALGANGKIIGTTTDVKTGESLVGVNIIIDGTALGAATDAEGNYIILQVPPGIYTVRASAIGYAEIRNENVRVVSDLTTRLDIQMRIEAVEGESVTVVVERPLFEQSATNEVRVVRGEDIQQMTVRNYANVAALQTGVVADGGNLFVRGGRSEETAFYVDGILMNNPYNLGRVGDIPNLSLEEVAYQSGGFNAEYGNANSGIVSTSSRTGGERFEASAETYFDAGASAPTVSEIRKNYFDADGNRYGDEGFDGSTGKLNLDEPFAYNYGYQLFAGSVSGPVPGLNYIRYFLSGEQVSTDDRTPSWGTHPQWLADSEEYESQYGTGSKIDDLDTYGVVGVGGPLPENWEKRMTLNGNLLIDLRQMTGLPLKFKLGGSYYDRSLSAYSNTGSAFNYYLDGNTWTHRFNYQEDYTKTLYARTTFTLSPRTFAEAQISLFEDYTEVGDPEWRDKTGRYPLSNGKLSEEEIPFINYGKTYDLEFTFADSLQYIVEDDIVVDSVLITYVTETDTLGVFNPQLPGQGLHIPSRESLALFTPLGMIYDDFSKNLAEYTGVTYSLTHQAGMHEFKLGGEYRANTISYYRIATPRRLAGLFYGNPPQDRAGWLAGHPGKNDDDYDEYLFNEKYKLFKNAYAENQGYNIFGGSSNIAKEDEARTPSVSAFYVQDKIELKDLILNLGIRWDIIDPQNMTFNPAANGAESIVLDEDGFIADQVYILEYDDEGLPLYHSSIPTTLDSEGLPQRIPGKKHTQTSPRIGMAFPVTDKTVFHAQYGKFYQHPQLNRLFMADIRLAQNIQGGNFTLSANPDLEPVSTTSYEIGMKQMIGQDASIDATVFYKQQTGQVQVRQIVSYPTVFATYVNGDYGTIKGLTLSFNMRRVNGVQANANYTLQWAAGTGSTANGQYKIAWQGGNYPTFVSPLDYDQRHTGNISIDYRTPSKGLLGDFGVNLLAQFGSGLRYTPTQIATAVFASNVDYPIAPINSGTMPSTVSVDLRLDKTWTLAGTRVLTYVVITNLLNSENADFVYTGSGQTGNDGWLKTKDGQDWLNAPATAPNGRTLYNLRNGSPGNWDAPRQVRFGIRIDL